MNQFNNSNVPSPHLFRYNGVRTAFPGGYPPTNPLPSYTPLSRRPPGYSPPTLNPSPYSNPSPYQSSYPYHSPFQSVQAFPNHSAYPRPAAYSNTQSYSTSYPVQSPGTSLSPFPELIPAAYGVTAWPSRNAIPPISDKGLEAILIAILILVALDLAIVRPHKEN